MRGVTTPSLRWMIATIWILMSKVATRAQFAAPTAVKVRFERFWAIDCGVQCLDDDDPTIERKAWFEVDLA
ncbi:hypothetical protein QBC47DRAFT_385539 [Echria macrotheca]|uniref:Secreted protein n=1 Tax=Echria macrotheca TaxID=438768 RepID=A0AAJ0B9Q7_9PEZI|nr:hypothetical protein QBC47DRAFT_385539 [Echria macrotheca]